MYDNTNNLTATLEGCSIKSEAIENLGEHTFLSADQASARVIVESSDFGGIPSFIGDDNKFFIIKYMGKMPKITYQYHFNDAELDTIFEIDPSGNRFGKLTFKPVDDAATGSEQSILNLGILDSYGTDLLNGVDTATTSSTFAIHSFIGGSRRSAVSEESYIGISAYRDGIRSSLLKVLGTGLILGSVSKRIMITLSSSTKLESFSIGELKLFEATSDNEEMILGKETLHNMINEPEYLGYNDNIVRFKKMLDHPNKIFNTESGL